MNYIGLTFSYLKKNFTLPMIVMMIPAIAACFLSTPYWEVSFVSAYNFDPYVSFRATFVILFSDSWRYLWPVAVISVLQICAASLVMSAVDRHFRTGKFSMRSPFKLMNVSVFPMAFGVLIMCAVGIVWRFVLLGFVALVEVVAEAIGMPAIAALCIITVIAIGMFVVHVMIITPLLYWAPIMFIYGYRPRDAASMSFKMISGKNTFLGLFLPMLPCVLIQLLVGFLQPPIWTCRIINFIVFLFTNTYVTVYVIVSFYHISELDRRDVVTYATIPLPKTVASLKPASSPTPVEKPEKPNEPAKRGGKKKGKKPAPAPEDSPPPDSARQTAETEASTGGENVV